MTLKPVVGPPRRRLLAALLLGLAGLSIGVVSWYAGVQCGERAESRRWSEVVDDPVVRFVPPRETPRVRGDLWLKCPSSSTWYNYAGDRPRWVASTYSAIP